MSAFADFDVRIDPWDIDYGSELPIDSAEEFPAEDVELEVEVPADRWRPIVPVLIARPDHIIFVDGVRRIEARLIVRRGEQLCHGAFGSFAVGSVRLLGGHAEWGEERVYRVVALGSGERLPSNVRVTAALVYEPASAATSDAEAPLRAIQERMRLAEESLARELADAPDRLVIADGPLTFSEPVRGEAVGYVKRLFRMYLPRTHLGILPDIPVGGRTPVFALRSTRRFARYSWFVRLSAPRGADSPFAGIVRLEVAEAVGAEGAKRIADATASCLPRLAPSRGRDPRAPQNLLPIGALEGALRRRLGDARLVRRHIEALVAREIVHD
jgi:hypothetical protein